ncbi:MAG: hypothetical protein Fur0037_29410 [Planctomycetota bacterium]
MVLVAARAAREGKVARKAHDLFSLLQTRGARSARRPRGVWGSLWGFASGSGSSGSRSRDDGRRRRIALSGPALAAIVFASLGAGYLVGDSFPMRQSGTDLNAEGQRRAGIVPTSLKNAGEMSAEEECRKLGSNALLVSFHGDSASERRDEASAMARFLRSQGLDKARILKIWVEEQTRWLAVVYYANDEEKRLSRQRLLSIRFPPEYGVDRFKKLIDGWPREWAIE